jgi:hypothetical protein
MGCEHPHHSESDGMAEKCAARQACQAHPLDTPALEPNPESRSPTFFSMLLKVQSSDSTFYLQKGGPITSLEIARAATCLTSPVCASFDLCDCLGVGFGLGTPLLLRFNVATMPVEPGSAVQRALTDGVNK